MCVLFMVMVKKFLLEMVMFRLCLVCLLLFCENCWVMLVRCMFWLMVFLDRL